VIHHKISLANQHAREDFCLLAITWSAEVLSSAPSQRKQTERETPRSPTAPYLMGSLIPLSQSRSSNGFKGIKPILRVKGNQSDTGLSCFFPPPHPLLNSSTWGHRHAHTSPSVLLCVASHRRIPTAVQVEAASWMASPRKIFSCSTAS